MSVSSMFASFLGLFSAIGLPIGSKPTKYPLKKEYGRVSKRKPFRDPYPNHRHKSAAEKKRILAMQEKKRTHSVTVGTNHERVVAGRAARQGITVDEYKLRWG